MYFLNLYNIYRESYDTMVVKLKEWRGKLAEIECEYMVS